MSGEQIDLIALPPLPERVAYWCRSCPATFPDGRTSNAHHEATGHHQTWKRELAYKATPAAEKARVLLEHEKGHEDRLVFIRTKLRELYAQRDHEWRRTGAILGREAFVTADDAATILEKASNLGYTDDDAPRPWFGSIFRERGWRWTGKLVPSLRKKNNGRGIRCWQWRGP